MLNRLPRYLPSINDLLHDIGRHPDDVAKAIGVSIRSMSRYRKTGRTPRPILLSIWWLTRYGQSTIFCDLTRENATLRGLVRCLQGNNQQQIPQQEAANDYRFMSDFNKNAKQQTQKATSATRPQKLLHADDCFIRFTSETGMRKAVRST